MARPKRSGEVFTYEDQEIVVQYVREGLTVVQIAEIIGVPYTTITQ